MCAWFTDGRSRLSLFWSGSSNSIGFGIQSSPWVNWRHRQRVVYVRLGHWRELWWKCRRSAGGLRTNVLSLGGPQEGLVKKSVIGGNEQLALVQLELDRKLDCLLVRLAVQGSNMIVSFDDIDVAPESMIYNRAYAAVLWVEGQQPNIPSVKVHAAQAWWCW